ncbi:hypothetical protein ACFLSE_06845 [Bacteroidota bacterium]
MKNRIPFILSIALVVLFSSCENDNNEDLTGISLPGTLLMPRSFEGESFGIYIDNNYDRGNGVVASYRGTCGSGITQSFTFPNVPTGGPYLLYAFVPDEPSTTIITHIGYYGANDGNYENADSITIEPDGPTTLNSHSIQLFSVGVSVIGKLLTTTEHEGDVYTVYVDDDTDNENGFVSSGSYTFGSGLEHNFGMGGQSEGEYYFYAETETLIGFYGSSDGDPLNAQKITIALNINTAYEINMFSKD